MISTSNYICAVLLLLLFSDYKMNTCELRARDTDTYIHKGKKTKYRVIELHRFATSIGYVDYTVYSCAAQVQSSLDTISSRATFLFNIIFFI